MRPFWRYYGGKWRAAPRYPEPPPGLPIVEPFAGAAGYATRYGAGREVLLVDASPVVCSVWSWLIGATPAEVLDLPETREPGLPAGASALIGFWFNNGSATPKRTRSTWGDALGKPNWGPEARLRLAAQVPLIRGWRVMCGDYTMAPDIEATWFVDPPYQTAPGRHYPHDFTDHEALGAWCRTRRGLTIACDQRGADWLPWNTRVAVKARRSTSEEVAWIQGAPQLRLL